MASIHRIADNQSISKSPDSFARIRAKKAGLQLKADKMIVKPFDKSMTKLIGQTKIVQKEEIMLVDFVVGKGDTSKKLEIIEDKVITELNKKKQAATLILKDTDFVNEMSEV